MSGYQLLNQPSPPIEQTTKQNHPIVLVNIGIKSVTFTLS